MKKAFFVAFNLLFALAFNAGAQTVPIVKGLTNHKQITIGINKNQNYMKLGLANENGYFDQEVVYNGESFSIEYPANGERGGYFDEGDALSYKFPGLAVRKIPVGSKLLLGYHDFDSDGEYEVVLAVKYKDNLYLNVFRKQYDYTPKWALAGTIVKDGYYDDGCVTGVNPVEITFPVGSQGLYESYSLYYGELVEDGSGLKELITKAVNAAETKAIGRHPSSAVVSIKLLGRDKNETAEIISLNDKYSIDMKGKLLGVNVYNIIVNVQSKLLKNGGDIIISGADVLSDSKR